ncbi:MAG: methyltransferase domain-containing protein [Lachnospiraceae bacterium]|nr:methyltransferase domain-containing protein [Lachnospiraceae bacterium]
MINMSGNIKRVMTSRELSLEVIYNVLENGEYLKESVDSAISKNGITDARDRAFISMLCEGTVERMIELDYIIDQYSSKRTEKLKPYIRNILRMTVYQIKYMDRVPDSASVDEAVKLAVKKGYGGLRGFVNGVLRNVARTYKNIEYPDREREPVKYFSVMYAMPAWIVRHFINELKKYGVEKNESGADKPVKDGQRTDNIKTVELVRCLEYFLTKPELTIRPGTISRKAVLELESELSRAGFAASRGRIFEYALRLKSPGKIEDIPGYSDGRFVVQDESSMIPAHVIAGYISEGTGALPVVIHYSDISDAGMSAEPSPGSTGRLRLLDMCAAPGGKALHAASLLGDLVDIEARDVSDAKTAMIRANIERLGIDNIHVCRADALIRNENDRESYDIIIADLPCSGLGVIAKKPDIKYHIDEKGMDSLASIQSDMLDNAAAYVKSGGIIVYSTCTVNIGENENNCRAFLDRHPEFVQVNVKRFVPEHIRESVDEFGSIKIIPGRYKSDGFFVAMFRRR